MIDQNQSTIFHLEVDDVAKSHMLEMGRWGKFLSIVGFIMIGLMLTGGFFYSIVVANMYGSLLGGAGTFFFYIFFLISAGLMLYPIVALYRFSSRIKPALQHMNKAQFNSAFANLKGMLKYCGIMAIITLCFYGLIIILFVVSLGMSQ